MGGYASLTSDTQRLTAAISKAYQGLVDFSRVYWI